MQEFRNFIRSSENTNTSNNSISFHTRIPVLHEPEIFSGSPIDYPLWKSSLEALVHNTEITAEQKCSYYVNSQRMWQENPQSP